MLDCPKFCSADLSVDLMSTISSATAINIIDRACNQAFLLNDDAGLIDVDDAASGPYMTPTGGSRVKIIASLDEILAHYTRDSEVFKAAQYFFGNKDRGLASYFVLGFWDKAGGESVAAALDEIAQCHPCFCHGSLVHFDAAGDPLFDTADALAFAEWFQVNGRMSYQDSFNPLTEDSADMTNLKAQMNALNFDCQSVFYQLPRCGLAFDALGEPVLIPAGDPVVDHLGDPVADPAGLQNPWLSDGTIQAIVPTYPYEAFMAAGWAAGADLSQSGSGYTLNYKPQNGVGWAGIAPSGFSSTQVFDVTGFFPDATKNPSANGHANVYVQTSGSPHIYPGVTVTGRWIDCCHLDKFLRRALRDQVANLFLNTRRVPYDGNIGGTMILNRLQPVFQGAQGNGHFTSDPVDWAALGYTNVQRQGTGWIITADTFDSQTAGRRAIRKSPVYKFCYVKADAVHHVPVEICVVSPQA